MMHDRRSFLGAVAATALLPRWSQAQGSNQPLRIVVPFSAGSGTDITARTMSDTLARLGGRAVIVDNKAGAGGVLGAMEVARARPDGNTVLYTTGGFTTNAVLIRKLPFDPIADFTPIAMQSRSSGFALLVAEKSPYKTLAEYIAAAKARPGQITFGSSGVGNTTHVMGVLFGKGVGVDLLHVPFKGTPTTDLIAGTVDSAFLSPSVAAPQIRAGQLRALGISGTERSSLLPDVPTFAEAGLKVQDIPAWSGVWGPAKMAPETVRALHDLFERASMTPEMLKYARDNGGEPATMTSDAFRAYVTSEIERYRKLLPPLGIEIG